MNNYNKTPLITSKNYTTQQSTSSLGSSLSKSFSFSSKQVFTSPKITTTSITSSKGVISSITSPKSDISSIVTPKSDISSIVTPKSVISSIVTPKSIISSSVTPKSVISSIATPKNVTSSIAIPNNTESSSITPTSATSNIVILNNTESSSMTPKNNLINDLQSPVKSKDNKKFKILPDDDMLRIKNFNIKTDNDNIRRIITKLLESKTFQSLVLLSSSNINSDIVVKTSDIVTSAGVYIGYPFSDDKTIKYYNICVNSKHPENIAMRCIIFEMINLMYIDFFDVLRSDVITTVISHDFLVEKMEIREYKNLKLANNIINAINSELSTGIGNYTIMDINTHLSCQKASNHSATFM